jgi:hypothetical protein
MSEFKVGRVGWIGFRDEEEGPWAYVQVALAPSDRLTITRVVLHKPDGVTTENLRSLPLGRIEAAANGQLREDILQVIDDEEAVGVDPQANFLGRPEIARNVKDLFIHFGMDETTVTSLMFKSATKKEWMSLAKVTIPKGRTYPPSFYKSVAGVYNGLIFWGSKRPAGDIAEANRVPVSTVHRWVKEARRLGYLAPGQRGKVS